jgi:hypothetical protein
MGETMMPYIKAEDYARAKDEAAVPGELNYAMTMASLLFMRGDIDGEEFTGLIQELVDGYLDRNGTSYTNYNNVIGALTCCGFELIRRVNTSYHAGALYCQLIMCRVAYALYHDRCAAYEDTKIEENGDVYPKEMLA